MEIIGLSGYARSGKDAAAKVLVEEFGFTRVAFADKLREVLYALNPIVESYFWYPDPPNGLDSKPEDGTGIFLQEVIDSVGWDGYKETRYGPEIRRLLQRLGTEAGRKTLWDSIWIDAALTGYPDDAKIVVTDCRFPNEAQAIYDRGGKMWRIKRNGVGPATSADGSVHSSETSLDDWSFDSFIVNNGTLEQFEAAVMSLHDRSGEDIIIKFADPIELTEENKRSF